ncbi:MAG: hypothetical protein ACOYD4_17570 [Solirubrobacterales bacterium]
MPGETRSYHLDLSPWKLATAPSTLSLLATFETSTGVRQAVATSLELSAPSPLDVDKIASVEIKASLTTLKSGHTEQVYLLVKNKAAQSLTVKKVVPSKPSFIEFENLPQDVEVGPGEISVLSLDAKAKSKVRPGEYQLVFKLPSEIGSTGFDLVTSETAKVGVEGEAELLTLFGIPSLLLLPGFLVLATASLLWRLRLLREDWDGDAFPFPLKEPEFWVLAVLASIAIVLLATLFGIELLDQYGLEDLIAVWIASMLIGLFLYLPIMVVRNEIRSARVPNETDAPTEVLRKLAKQGLDLMRPSFSYDTGSGTQRLFLLQAVTEDRPSTWVAPRITYSWAGNVDRDLNDRLQQQIDMSHDAEALAASLEDGVQNGLLTVAYSGGAGELTSPTLVEKGKIGTTTMSGIAGEA